VQLAKEAKLGFSVDATGLKIEGVDSTNPVIFDNERWDNGVDNEFIWAKASLGKLDLRGDIVTADVQTGQNTVAAQMAAAREELRLATLAGMHGIPEFTAGAEARLVLPPSGRIEDILPLPSAGSDLIVAEARKATPEKPLLVVAGGPLTTVAQAYLTDPSIASRMVVASVFTYNLQSRDSAANYLVAKKCRYVQWGRNYTWAGKQDTTRLKDIPLTRMGEKLRGFIRSAPVKLPLGDMAPVAFLYQRNLWKTAQMVKVNSALEVQAASDITFDFLDIPADANDWQGFNDAFYATMSDSRLYAPIAVPGKIVLEAYYGRSGISYIPYDSTEASTGVALPQGAWVDYRVSAAAAGNVTLKLRYRCGAGGTASVGLPDQAPLAGTNLAPTVLWTDAAIDSVPLQAGTTVLRITATAGKVDLIGLEIR
jgi:hypothetical protein